MADLRRQAFVVARLADYCDYRRLDLERNPDPVFYLAEKLRELEGPLYELKQELLQDTVRDFLAKAAQAGVGEQDIVEFRQFLDRFVPRGDFADASFHLDAKGLRETERLKWAEQCLRGLRVWRLLDEESRPAEKRDASWEKLVAEIFHRLDFDLLERMVVRKPLAGRRLRFLLRRCRFNTADYCAVFHLPIHAGDAFTPFILPRVEALVAANRRLLRRFAAR